MIQEKPGWWPLWYTLEKAKQLAAEETRKNEEAKLKNSVKWQVKKILPKK